MSCDARSPLGVRPASCDARSPLGVDALGAAGGRDRRDWPLPLLPGVAGLGPLSTGTAGFRIFGEVGGETELAEVQLPWDASCACAPK